MVGMMAEERVMKMMERSKVDGHNSEDNLTVFSWIRNFHWYAALTLILVAFKLIHINSYLIDYFLI